MENQDDIAEFIRAVLEEKKLSEPAVAKKTGQRVTQSVINKLKNRRVSGSKAEIASLYWLAIGLDEAPVEVFARALGVGLKELGIPDPGSELLLKLQYYLARLPEHRLLDLVNIAALFAQDDKHGVAEKGENVMTLEEAVADNEAKKKRNRTKK